MSRTRILSEVRALPALPTGAGQLIALLQDPDVNINRLIQRIEYDPGLTSNVLRLANSSYFAGPRSIASLRDAIVRLGTRRILQLVITSAVAPLARKPVRGYDLSAGQLLEHSVAVAVAAEQLAALLPVRAPDHLFTAALLHDLGKIVLGTFLRVRVEPVTKLAFEEGLSFDEAERRVLDTDHAEVGALLLAEWGLPSSIVDVVAQHHHPQHASEDPLTTDLVHAADQLVLSSALGSGIDGLNYRPCAESLDRLRLTPRIEELALSRTFDALEELRGVINAF